MTISAAELCPPAHENEKTGLYDTVRVRLGKLAAGAIGVLKPVPQAEHRYGMIAELPRSDGERQPRQVPVHGGLFEVVEGDQIRPMIVFPYPLDEEGRELTLKVVEPTPGIKDSGSYSA